jgi:hypothetical protein
MAWEGMSEILVEVGQQVRLISNPMPVEHRGDETWHILAVVDSSERLPKTRSRSRERDLEVGFRDGSLMGARAREPHAARRIHEASGAFLRM